jgi:ABC-type Fe3+-hydroxamate transport system substrate-binding protein
MKQFILGIESSCDETSVAVYDYANNKLLANIVSSQISTHTKYGGVMPEIASRLHIEKINYVIKEALYEANITFNDLSAIAVTSGPGLIGALHVGLQAAKTLALALDIPLLSVHHLVGHIYANSFEQVKNEILQIAKITGHTSTGENLVKEIDSAINKINSQNQLLQKPTVYWEVWNSPFMSVGNSSFINDLIKTAGGINIFQEIAQAYPTVSEETIVAKNPQIIIIPQNSGITVDSVKNRKGWSQIDAVKNDKIFIVDDNLLTRSGARIGESAEYLANLFR